MDFYVKARIITKTRRPVVDLILVNDLILPLHCCSCSYTKHILYSCHFIISRKKILSNNNNTYLSLLLVVFWVLDVQILYMCDVTHTGVVQQPDWLWLLLAYLAWLIYTKKMHKIVVLGPSRQSVSRESLPEIPCVFATKGVFLSLKNIFLCIFCFLPLQLAVVQCNATIFIQLFSPISLLSAFSC